MALLITDKCEAAFLAYLLANRSDTDVAALPFEPGLKFADRPCPICIVNGNAEDAKDLPQRGVFAVFLHLTLDTNAAHDVDAAAHKGQLGAIFEILNDKDALREALNAGGTVRPNEDFHVYDYFLISPGKTVVVETGEWETTIKLRVVCQGADRS